MVPLPLSPNEGLYGHSFSSPTNVSPFNSPHLSEPSSSWSGAQSGMVASNPAYLGLNYLVPNAVPGTSNSANPIYSDHIYGADAGGSGYVERYSFSL